MGQQIINISTPNDGLGDPLRSAFEQTNNNFTELYDGKVSKVTGKDLSTNDFTDLEQAKLAGIEDGAQVNVRGNLLQDDNTQPDYIFGRESFFPAPLTSVTKVGVIGIAGLNVTIASDEFRWKINNILFSNPSFAQTLIAATTGFYRYDLVLGNVDGDIVILSGIENAALAIEPDVPAFTVKLASILVFGNTVSSTTIVQINDEPQLFTASTTGTNQTFVLSPTFVAKQVFKSRGVLFKGTEWTQDDDIITILVNTNSGNSIYITP